MGGKNPELLEHGENPKIIRRLQKQDQSSI
jgi:hypothetical protein